MVVVELRFCCVEVVSMAMMFTPSSSFSLIRAVTCSFALHHNHTLTHSHSHTLTLTLTLTLTHSHTLRLYKWWGPFACVMHEPLV